MKIQKRIMISNTQIIILALLTLLFFSGFLFNILQIRENAINKVLGNMTVFDMEECLVEFDGNDINELENILEENDYQFLIYDDDDLISENSDTDEDMENQISEIELENQPSLSYIDDNIVIGSVITVDDNTYDVYLITQITSINKTSEDFETFMIKFILFGLMAVCVIGAISLIFTRRMTKRIMEPVNKLLNSAQRVENGDLSGRIEYSGEVEFEKLCDSFNHMQEHLKLEQEKNLMYEKAKTDMVVGISHDLRTPLTSIKGYVKGILDGVASNPEKQRAYLEIVYNKSLSMEKLLQKLFLFSKLETGNLPFNFLETDMKIFLDKFVQEARSELKQRKVELEFLASDENEYPVNIDTEQITRVLENLIENAVKYAGNPSLKIQIRLEKSEHFIFVKIHDNGMGIAEDKIDKIFEQFYRVDEARGTKENEGNGLGLYIVKYIIESHEGTINAKNDNGLRITIMLPLINENNDLDEN